MPLINNLGFWRHFHGHFWCFVGFSSRLLGLEGVLMKTVGAFIKN